MQPARSEFNKGSVGALIASMVGVGFGSIGTQSLPVFLTAIAAEYGGRGKVSFLFTVAGMCGYLGTLVIGACVDRWGARRVVPLVSAFSAIAVTLAWFSRPFGLSGLFLLFAVMGFGGSTLAAYSKLLAGWFRGRRGLSFALSGMGHALVWALVIPQAASALHLHFDWRECYGIMGLAVLATCPLLVFALVRDPPSHASGGAPALEGEPMSHVWRSPLFWLIIGSVCAEAMTNNSVRGHLVALMTDRGVSSPVAVGVLSAGLIGTLLGQPLTGWLLDRFQTSKVALPFVLMTIIGLLMLTFGRSLPVWIAGYIVMVFGYAGEVLMAPYFFTRYFGPKNHGKIYGSMFICLGPITALSPFVMGLVFDATQSYRPVLLAFVGALMLGGLCVTLLPKYRYSAAGRRNPPADPAGPGLAVNSRS